MSTTTATLTGLLIFAATVWIGGLVTIAVVARVATHTLEPASRVAFFRGLGRTYGVVGTGALALAYATGGTLVYGRSWDATLAATAAIAAALAAVLAAGIVQARRMTQLRRQSLDRSDPTLNSRVRRSAARAGTLRGVIALLSLALLAFGVALGANP